MSVQTICNGCGKSLVQANSWMYDGCPCNSAKGCNNGNQLISDWRQAEGQTLNFKLELAYIGINRLKEKLQVMEQDNNIMRQHIEKIIEGGRKYVNS